jgi:signal transduction histidine kinase
VVEDDGPGIEPQHLGRIFDRFYRADAARTGGGAGLGLSIAKEIVEAHGGHISVSSEPGRGSVFTVVIPRGADRR